MSFLPFVINAVFLQGISTFLCFYKTKKGTRLFYETYSLDFKNNITVLAAYIGRSADNGTKERQEALYRCH